MKVKVSKQRNDRLRVARAEAADRRNCDAAFRTPDGVTWYCQRHKDPEDPENRSKHGDAKDEDPAAHLFDVKLHAVRWRGSASDESEFCGNPCCLGAVA